VSFIISEATSIARPRFDVLAPPLGGGLSGPDHGPAERGDLLAVKGRLRDPPLPEPRVAVGREEAHPEEARSVMKPRVSLEKFFWLS
jgi:hypothetical protein